MKVKFLQDYSGRETAMKQYKKGDEVLLDFHAGAQLVALGIAVPVDIEKPKAKKEKVNDENTR